MNMFFWMAIISVVIALIFGLIYWMQDEKNVEWVVTGGVFIVAALLLCIAGTVVFERERRQACRDDGGIPVDFKTGNVTCTNIPVGDVYVMSCSDEWDWRCDNLPAERPVKR